MRFSGQRPSSNDRIEQLERDLALLKREVAHLKTQTLTGLAVRTDPASGNIVLGNVPATIEEDGIHFKDTGYGGDGLTWDAGAAKSFIQGWSSATESGILIEADDQTPDDRADFYLYGTDDDPKIVFHVYLGATSATLQFDERGLFINKPYILLDGMTAPSAISGYAQIYVDTADGDLKVTFGDNVTKTLATDTA